MDLRNLSDEELLKSTLQAAADERAATTRLLKHLCEIQRRRLFAKYACASLFEYCVKILQMSEPQAARRINAARLLKEFPAIERKINSGALSLTAASQAQTFFRKENFDQKKKAEVLARLENQSARESEKILFAYSTKPAAVVRETVKRRDTEFTEIKFAADEATMEDLQRLKEIWSHEMPNASFADLIKKMAQYCRKNLEKNPAPTPAPESEKPRKTTRYIPAAVRRAVWQRDGGGCTFTDEHGNRCGSRHKLQLDHIIPYAGGGKHTPENLRLRCFAHNQWHSIQTYGPGVLRFATS